MTRTRLFRYERRGQRLLEPGRFYRRLLAHFVLLLALVAVSLLLGMIGYAHYEGWSWTDAFLNASMLLAGMGPVKAPATESGKLFAGSYALYSGLVFLIAVGIVVAPVFHRILHRFHWDQDDAP